MKQNGDFLLTNGIKAKRRWYQPVINRGEYVGVDNLVRVLKRRKARDMESGEVMDDSVSRLAGERIEKLEEENADLKRMIREALITMNPDKGDWFLKADEYKLRRVIREAFDPLMRRAKAIHARRAFWD